VGRDVTGTFPETPKPTLAYKTKIELGALY